jgi:hypothetical protein
VKAVGSILTLVLGVVLAGIFTTGDRHIGRLTAAGFLDRYYSIAVENPSFAWSMQQQNYQAISGSYSNFEAFISTYRLVEVDRVDVDPVRDGYYIARVTYTPRNGGSKLVERRSYLLRCSARIWFSILRSSEECQLSDVLIADSRIL